MRRHISPKSVGRGVATQRSKPPLLERVAGRLVAADTMVFIHYLDAHPEYAPLLDPLFEKWERGESNAVASVLIVAETLVGPLRTGAKEAAGNAVQWLSGLPGLEIVPVTLDIGIRAAELRAEHGLPMADSLHAATALVRGADLFLTNDRGFTRLRQLEPVFLDDFL